MARSAGAVAPPEPVTTILGWVGKVLAARLDVGQVDRLPAAGKRLGEEGESADRQGDDDGAGQEGLQREPRR